MTKRSEADVRAGSALNQRLNAAQLPLLKRALSTSSLVDTLAEVQRIAALPLEDSVTLPREAYTSEEFYAWEVEQLFRKEWLCLAHGSQLPNPGDYLNLDVLGEPLIVVRDKGRELRVLSRVCPHRGADIMPAGFGIPGHGGCANARVFTCPYHAWSFELDGSLRACAEMDEARGFAREAWGLTAFRSEVWLGFVFVNFDGAAPKTVAEQYAGIAQHVAPWNVAGMRVVMERAWELPCNWKVLAENFMESYHHAGTHAKTLQRWMPARDTWIEGEQPHYIKAHLPYKDKTRREIGEAEARGEQWDAFPPLPQIADERRFEWGLFMGYPLFTFVVAADQLVWYRILPQGPDQLALLTTVMVPESTTAHPEFASMLERASELAVAFHLEDMEVLSGVQRCFYSAGYRRGRLSHLEMPIWLIQRYLAARARGTWPTLDHAPAPGQR